MSIKRKLIEFLEQGPATTKDVVASGLFVGKGVYAKALSYLRELSDSGVVSRTHYIKPPQSLPRGGRRTSSIWALKGVAGNENPVVQDVASSGSLCACLGAQPGPGEARGVGGLGVERGMESAGAGRLENSTQEQLMLWAAQAASFAFNFDGGMFFVEGAEWNPIENDGDAFRLASVLELQITFDTSSGNQVIVKTMNAENEVREARHTDPGDETKVARELIVFVAAALGRACLN